MVIVSLFYYTADENKEKSSEYDIPSFQNSFKAG